MEIFGLIALVAGYIAAFKYSHLFAKPFLSAGMDEKAAAAMGYVAGFLAAYVVTIIIGSLLSRAFKEVKLGYVNRGGGLVFGGIKAAVILGLLLSTMLTVLQKKSDFSKNLQSGAVSGSLAKISPFVYKMMNSVPDVKKINPFDVPKVEKPADVVDILENDTVKDAIEAVKDSEAVKQTQNIIDSVKEKAEETAESLNREKPLANPLQEMQKD
jgi:membrane protein required for colicin V production